MDHQNPKTHWSLAIACCLLMAAAAPGFADNFIDWVDANGVPTPQELKALQQGDTATPSQPLLGTITVFTDRPTFEAMFPGLPNETFDATNVAPGNIVGCPAPFDSTTSNACYSPGALMTGFRVEDDPLNGPGAPGDAAEGLVALGTGFFGNSSPTVAANTFTNSFNVFFDDPDVTAVGMDVVTYTTSPATVDVQVFDTSDVLIDSTTVSATNDGTFLGISSPTPIGRININNPVNTGDGAEGLDDLSFGAGTAQLTLTAGTAILDQAGFVEVCETTPGNVNGILEPGETITIAPELTAAGGDFTGISATLSSADPNVLVVSGSSTYPDIMQGNSAGPDTPFQIYLDNAIPCGTMLSLDFAVTSDQDSFNEMLVGEVGQAADTSGAGFMIPDNDPTGASSTINIAEDLTLADVNVEAAATHSWVGDLVVTVESPSATVVTLIDQPGVPASGFGCSDNNFDLTFDDAAGGDPGGENTCNGTDPWLTGSIAPLSPLSAFNGESSMGTWTITVSDNAGGDTGTLDSWALVLDPAPTGVCNACGDGAPTTGAPVTEIPTVDWRGMLLLIALLSGAAFFLMRRH